MLLLGMLAAGLSHAQDVSPTDAWAAPLLDSLAAASSPDAARAEVVRARAALGPATHARLAALDMVLRRVPGWSGPELRALLSRALSEREEERAELLRLLGTLDGQLELLRMGLLSEESVVASHTLAVVDTWWYSCDVEGRTRAWSLLDPAVVAAYEEPGRIRDMIGCDADAEPGWTLTLGGAPLVAVTQASDTPLGAMTCTPRRLPVRVRGKDQWVSLLARPPDCFTREEATARVELANAMVLARVEGSSFPPAPPPAPRGAAGP